MPLGYKYVERDADSQINWAEVGKNLSDVLLETKRVREEKKSAIDQGIRESLNTLATAPQGVNQDVNNFTNNYTSDMSAQILLDKKLLQSGQMDLKDWTLRQQNYKDGTDQMFNLSKTYQEKSKEIMDGIDNNEIQSALGLHNMGTIEGFTNFNNSRATINSVGDGKVSLALYENKIIDGKEVRVLSKNNMPVNVLLGQIHNQPKKFNVEGATAATAKAFGSRFQAVYKAASTVGSGTITELLGIDAMRKYPQFKGIVDEMNTAINDQVDSYFAGNPLKVISVLGENTGNYNSSSFTYDKDEAAKDKKKILLTIDPRTQTATMDINAPHYKEQYKEATEWTKRSLMSKLDSEAKVSTTSQSQLQERRAPTEAENKRKEDDKKSADAANMIGKLYYGDKAQVESSISYFKGIKDKDGVPIFDEIYRTPQGLKVILANGTEENISFKDKTQEDFIRAAGPLLAGELDVNTALERGSYKKGAKFNTSVEGQGRNVKPNETYEKYLQENLDSNLIGMSEGDAIASIQKLAEIGGFTAEQVSPGVDEIEITRPARKVGTTEVPAVSKVFSFDESSPGTQEVVKKQIIQFLKINAVGSIVTKSLSGYSPTSKKPTPKKKIIEGF